MSGKRDLAMLMIGGFIGWLVTTIMRMVSV